MAESETEEPISDDSYSVTQLRIRALELANSWRESAEQVVARAREYEKFLKGR